MFKRIISAPGVHTALTGLIVAVIVAAGNGLVDEAHATKIADTLKDVLLALIAKGALERAALNVSLPAPKPQDGRPDHG